MNTPSATPAAAPIPPSQLGPADQADLEARAAAVLAANWRTASKNWAGYMDHNHLRITRIIRCLRVLGLQRESKAFFAALKRVAEDAKIRISNRSVEYWTRAAELPLHIPPSEGDDECEWLKEWASEQQ